MSDLCPCVDFCTGERCHSGPAHYHASVSPCPKDGLISRMGAVIRAMLEDPRSRHSISLENDTEARRVLEDAAPSVDCSRCGHGRGVHRRTKRGGWSCVTCHIGQRVGSGHAFVADAGPGPIPRGIVGCAACERHGRDWTRPTIGDCQREHHDIMAADRAEIEKLRGWRRRVAIKLRGYRDGPAYEILVEAGGVAAEKA